MRPILLGIEEAQRSLRPRAAPDPSYYYDSNGALILFDREKQVREAISLLARQCRSAEPKGFICEVAHPDVVSILASDFGSLLECSFVFIFSAPIHVRALRNKLRGALRMPDEVVNSIPDYLPEEVCETLRRLGSTVYRIDSSGALQEMFRQVDSAAQDFLKV